MKERPILFSAPMVRAILDGKKTQTRRLVKGLPRDAASMSEAGYDAGDRRWAWFDEKAIIIGSRFACPYGVPGDRLVLLTGWAADKRYDKTKPSELPTNIRFWTWFDGDTKPEWCGRTRMGRHMPGWARAKMPRADVVNVRVERVQSISEGDAKAEGVDDIDGERIDSVRYVLAGYLSLTVGDKHGCAHAQRHRAAFWHLWDSINGEGSWEANPWVWVVEFRRVQA